MKLTLLIIFLTTLSTGKVASCRTRFKGNTTFDYCTKFGAPANGKITVETTQKLIMAQNPQADPSKTAQYEVAIYQDDAWDQLADLPKDASCAVKRNLATQVHKVAANIDGQKVKGKKSEGTITLLSDSRPHMYYFVVLDCTKNFQKQFETRVTPRVLTTFSMLNHNPESQFSYEDQGLYSLYTYLFLAVLAISGLIIKGYMKSIKMHERYCSPHPIMLSALAFQCLALMMAIYDSSRYAGDGKGSLCANIFNKILDGISEVVMSMLLIQLASGWTVNYQELDFDDGLEIYIPMFALVVMCHIIIAALSFIDVDGAHRHHDFSGYQGWILMAIKLLIFLYWLWCYVGTRQDLEKRMKPYFDNLLRMSCAYLLAIPITIISTFLFEPYERNYIYVFFSQSIMFAANVALLYQVSGKKSSYSKANLDALGVLPGFENKSLVD